MANAAELAQLVVRTVNERPRKSWTAQNLVKEVKASMSDVSSADVKGTIWRLAGDHRIDMTSDRRVKAVRPPR